MKSIHAPHNVAYLMYEWMNILSSFYNNAQGNVEFILLLALFYHSIWKFSKFSIVQIGTIQLQNLLIVQQLVSTIMTYLPGVV